MNTNSNQSLAQLEIRSLSRLEVKHIKGGTSDQSQDIVIIDVITPLS